MGVLRYILRWWQSQPPADLARQIASRIYPIVWETVSGRTAMMSRAEARGYIRATAAPLVRAEIRAEIKADELVARSAEAILVYACDRVVQSILSEAGRRSSTVHFRRAA